MCACVCWGRCQHFEEFTHSVQNFTVRSVRPSVSGGGNWSNSPFQHFLSLLQSATFQLHLDQRRHPKNGEVMTVVVSCRRIVSRNNTGGRYMMWARPNMIIIHQPKFVPPFWSQFSFHWPHLNMRFAALVVKSFAQNTVKTRQGKRKFQGFRTETECNG